MFALMQVQRCQRTLSVTLRPSRKRHCISLCCQNYEHHLTSILSQAGEQPCPSPTFDSMLDKSLKKSHHHSVFLAREAEWIQGLEGLLALLVEGQRFLPPFLALK